MGDDRFAELETEWSYMFEASVFGKLGLKTNERFVNLAKGAMIVSFHKYGAIADGFGVGKKFSGIGSIEARLDRYENGYNDKLGGNTEWLVDVYNFAMIEYMHPNVPEQWLRNRKVKVNNKNRVAEIKRQRDLYLKDNNLFRLVIIGRLCRDEFYKPKHPNAYFAGTDTAESPGRASAFTGGLFSDKNVNNLSIRSFR